jgi:hypothetical protein
MRKNETYQLEQTDGSQLNVKHFSKKLLTSTYLDRAGTAQSV